MKHLAGDLRRSYAILTRQWLENMRFINTAYPYLFSLASRANPFDRSASVVVRES